MRRLLLACHESPAQSRLHRWWSTFRRRHQAGARRCHTARRARDHPSTPGRALILPLASTTPDVDDALWAQVASLAPPIRRYSDQSPLDQRMILAGILWVMRSGRSWRDLPACFGYWETIHDYYHRWKQKGYWQPILAVLQTASTPEAHQVSL